MWDDDWELNSSEPYGQWEERVLVVIVSTWADWERVRDQGWYRIPIARAPARIGAEYLAFYFPRAFGDQRWQVAYYAPIRRYQVVSRRELLPEAAEHPRAEALYYKFELGPLQALERPIVSQSLRRITFIMTTLSRLLTAHEIRDLWLRDTRQQRLGRAMRLGEAGPVGPSRRDEALFDPRSYSARMPGT